MQCKMINGKSYTTLIIPCVERENPAVIQGKKRKIKEMLIRFLSTRANGESKEENLTSINSKISLESLT